MLMLVVRFFDWIIRSVTQVSFKLQHVTTRVNIVQSSQWLKVATHGKMVRLNTASVFALKVPSFRHWFLLYGYRHYAWGGNMCGRKISVPFSLVFGNLNRIWYHVKHIKNQQQNILPSSVMTMIAALKTHL